MIRIANEQVHRVDVVAVIATGGGAGCRAVVYLADGRALRTGQAPATLHKKLRDPVFQKKK